MKRASPLVQMTVALIALSSTLLMLADLFFDVMPNREAQTMQLRKAIGESLAVQAAVLLQRDDRRALEQTFANVASRTDGVRSLAIRRADGEIVMQSGDHARVWHSAPTDSDRSSLEQITVPLKAGGERWGNFEIAFRPRDGNVVTHWLRQPMVVTLLFLSTFGALAFALYMRRALQHLDPASVIPDRVQRAFDAMTEGVAVLDTRGRLLLANKAFRGLYAGADAVKTGESLSALPWLAGGLPADVATHPWTRAMNEHAPSAGHTVEIGQSPDTRRLVINCAPIGDAGGSVRGCLVTFDDVSELHQANDALRNALAELSASKAEVERKSAELHRLATRDPLTGCLNRRAFHESFEALFRQARASGAALSCLMLDIDHFKAFNDAHGHAIGDRVIQEVAKKLQESARATDVVCRYGGEEFCVVVPGLDLAGAMAFAERLRQRVERECAAGVREVQGLRITVSVGVESLSSGADGTMVLLDRADQALYRAKRGGRNRVCDALGDGSATASTLPSPLDRRRFEVAFDRAMRTARERQQPLACLMVGLDELKAVHDGFGREVAERAVQAIGTLLLASARAPALVGRYSPDTFIIVTSGLTAADAAGFAEQLRAEIEQQAAGAVPVAPGLRLTASVGVDVLPGQALGTPTLPDRADQARLRARRLGGNRVCAFAQLLPAGGDSAASRPTRPEPGDDA